MLGLVLGLALSVLGFFAQGNALAQPETEERELVAANPKIDCSTNPAYDDNYITSAFKAGGHTAGRNQQCSSCHRSDSPTAGTGDRPVAQYGTMLLENLLAESVTYQLRIGKKGEWEKYELGPGKVRRHTWTYAKANQNRSPEYWLKYDVDPEKRPRKLTLIATPNKNLGAVYFFERDEKDNEVYLYQPGRQVSRR
jgi:hypothetical protein